MHIWTGEQATRCLLFTQILFVHLLSNCVYIPRPARSATYPDCEIRAFRCIYLLLGHKHQADGTMSCMKRLMALYGDIYSSNNIPLLLAFASSYYEYCFPLVSEHKPKFYVNYYTAETSSATST